MQWSWNDSSRLHRANEGQELTIPRFTVPSSDNDRPCGTVAITGSVDRQGTDISLVFTPNRDVPDDCCEQYGWIQHILETGWRYDNGALRPPHGHPSDPSRNPQGSNQGNRWEENPWYGGQGDVADGRIARLRQDLSGQALEDALDAFNQEWERNPQPQTTIRDHPGGMAGFIDQLVCVESGRVMFEYRWVQNRRRTEGSPPRWHFVGSQGNNLTIVP